MAIRTARRFPYAQDALAPAHLRRVPSSYHYGKHHQTYVDTLNKLVAGKPEESKSLEEIILGAPEGPLFNNAAQIWNHTFYWNSMKPGGRRQAHRASWARRSTRDFGVAGRPAASSSREAGKTQFGSGWTWLVKEGDGLAILNTDDADTPIKHGKTPLLTVDVWEHAYYLDYQNARPAYLETFVDKFLNWEFVATYFAEHGRPTNLALPPGLRLPFEAERASVPTSMSVIPV